MAWHSQHQLHVSSQNGKKTITAFDGTILMSRPPKAKDNTAENRYAICINSPRMALKTLKTKLSTPHTRG